MEIEEKQALARLYGTNGSLPAVTTTLGGTFLSLGDDTLEAQYVGAPAFLNPAGQVQGGMLCAMLDDVTATLVTSTLAEGEHCATLSLNTSFLRPAKPGQPGWPGHAGPPGARCVQRERRAVAGR